MLETTACLLCGSTDAPVAHRVPAQFSRGDRSMYEFCRCLACDLVFLNPRVRPEALGAYYDETYLPHRDLIDWGRYAPQVERAQRWLDRARVRLLRQQLPLDATHAVLDFGCGRPTFLRELVDATGCRGVGLDTTDGGWAHASTLAANLDLRRGELEALAPSEQFEAITLWHVLEHHYAPLDLLRTLRTHARPGARLIVEVPDYGGLTRRLQGRSWGGWHTPRHTAIYSAGTLASMLDRAGWVVERLLPYGTVSPYVLWWLGRRAQAGDLLEGSLEPAFLPYVAGLALSAPLIALQRWLRLGVQLAVARRAG